MAKMQLVSGKAEVIIGKQRHGPIGTVQLQFEANVTRFSDLARDQYMPERTGVTGTAIRSRLRASRTGAIPPDARAVLTDRSRRRCAPTGASLNQASGAAPNAPASSRPTPMAWASKQIARALTR